MRGTSPTNVFRSPEVHVMRSRTSLVRATLISVLAFAIGCGAPQLTVVKQPITCDCPWQTAVFQGTLLGGSIPPGQSVAAQALIETRPGRARVSFILQDRGVVCTLLASEGASLDPHQECVDPGRADATV